MNDQDSVAKEAIITIKAESLDAGLNELFKASSDIKFMKWIEEGVGIIYMEKGVKSLVDRFRQKPPIFIQHIFPLNFTINLQGNNEDLNTISKIIADIEPLLNKNKSFSVQTRILGQIKRTYKKFAINELLASNLQAKNFILDVKNPQQVISILFSNQTGYIGVSNVEDSISNWAGGRHRFAKETDQLSRAEFKLLEAIDVFKIAFPKEGIALDLGASPGGWTRVLLNFGLKVVAIDPAIIDKSVLDNPKVTHFRGTTGDYLRSNPSQQFDVIVNDMKMDMELSVKLILDAYKLLKTKGIVIMTLKLPKVGFEKRVKKSLKTLFQKYRIIGAKQLFHNRSEITVALKKHNI